MEVAKWRDHVGTGQGLNNRLGAVIRFNLRESLILNKSWEVGHCQQIKNTQVNR
jgi:hypothetical protein